ncbi:Lysosome membrane protein 2, partial [Geodia barretti]
MSESESSQEPYQEELVNVARGRDKARGCCRRHPVACGVTLLVVASLSLAVLGVALGIRSYLDQTFRDTVDQQVLLVPGTEGTKQFEKSSAPLYTKFYFFNVTNSDQILAGAKPVVTQVGPYVYREWRTKTNLTWNGNETVVHYDLNVTYSFEPSMSSGDPKHDKIITLNIPFYVLLQQIQGILGGLNEDERGLVLHLLEEARKLSGEGGLFTELVVYDLLFGYNDPLLVYIIKDIEALPDVLGDWVKKLKTFAKTINPLFGLENVTEVEYGNQVYTGKDDISQIGQFIEWNGNFEIYKHGGWGTPAAKMLNGTAGFIFPPGVKKGHNVTAFISELYRSGYFSFTEVKTLYGINLYRYALPGDELVSANQDPGFYANGPNGVLNLTA